MGYSVGLLRGGISRVTDITLGRLAQSYDLRSLGDCRTSLALRGDLTVGSFGRRRASEFVGIETIDWVAPTASWVLEDYDTLSHECSTLGYR